MSEDEIAELELKPNYAEKICSKVVIFFSSFLRSICREKTSVPYSETASLREK